MSRMICINSFVITVTLAIILLLGASVPTLGNGYDQNPSDSYQKPTGSNITCQSFGNLCPAEGSYKCCDELVCRPNTLGGASICLPPLGKEGEYPEYQGCREATKLCIKYGEYDCCAGLSCEANDPAGAGVCVPLVANNASTNDKCQKELQLCQTYGQYQCCPGFSCLDPRTLAAVLPPGAGLCFPSHN